MTATSKPPQSLQGGKYCYGKTSMQTFKDSLQITKEKMLDGKQKDIVKKGFEPPGRLSHTVLKFFMRLELLFFKNLPIGTSIMNAVFITKD